MELGAAVLVWVRVSSSGWGGSCRVVILKACNTSKALSVECPLTLSKPRWADESSSARNLFNDRQVLSHLRTKILRADLERLDRVILHLVIMALADDL